MPSHVPFPIPGPALLARSVIIAHLSAIPSIAVDVGVAKFPWEPEWTAYKQLHLPSMIVTKEDVSLPGFARPAVSTIMKFFALMELSERVAVAFLSSPNADGMIDYCREDVYVFSARPLKSKEVRDTKALLAQAVEELSARYGAAPAANDAAATRTVPESLITQVFAEFGRSPAVATVVAGAAAFAASPACEAGHLDWLRLLVTAAVLTHTLTDAGAPILSVADRGFSSTLIPAGTHIEGQETAALVSAITVFVHDVAAYCASVVSSRFAARDGQASALCDLMDARLLRVLRIAVQAAPAAKAATLAGLFGLTGPVATSVTNDITSAWGIISSALPASLKGASADLLPLVRAPASASHPPAAFIESLAKEATASAVAAVTPQSVKFFNAVLGINTEAATPVEVVATVKAPAAVASTGPVAVEIEKNDDGGIDWEASDDDEVAETKAPEAPVATAGSSTVPVLRPWPECAAPCADDHRHGLLKIPDPLSYEFARVVTSSSTFFAFQTKIRAESLVGGYVRTETIHETASEHPWPYPITAPPNDVKDDEDDEDEDNDTTPATAAAAGKVTVSVAAAGGAAPSRGARGGRGGRGGRGAKTGASDRAEPPASKSDAIRDKNARKINEGLLSDARTQLTTVMEAVNASESASHYDRALLELKRFNPRSSDSSKPLTLGVFSEPDQIKTYKGMLMEVEEKRIHLMRMMWNNDANALKA